jgi:hypothetical protein
MRRELVAVSILANGGQQQQPMSSQGCVSFLRVVTTARPDTRYMSYWKTNVHMRLFFPGEIAVLLVFIIENQDSKQHFYKPSNFASANDT